MRARRGKKERNEAAARAPEKLDISFLQRERATGKNKRVVVPLSLPLFLRVNKREGSAAHGEEDEEEGAEEKRGRKGKKGKRGEHTNAEREREGGRRKKSKKTAAAPSTAISRS